MVYMIYPKSLSNFTDFLDTVTASHKCTELIIHDVDSFVGKRVPSCKVEGQNGVFYRSIRCMPRQPELQGGISAKCNDANSGLLWPRPNNNAVNDPNHKLELLQEVALVQQTRRGIHKEENVSRLTSAN